MTAEMAWMKVMWGTEMKFIVYQTTNVTRISLGKRLTQERSVCGGQASLITAEKHNYITLFKDFCGYLMEKITQ